MSDFFRQLILSALSKLEHCLSVLQNEPLKKCFWIVFVFEIASGCVVQIGLELTVILLPSTCYDDMFVHHTWPLNALSLF